MELSCRNCGRAAKLVTHLNDEQVVRCEICGAFQFVGPVGDLSELYTEEYYNGAEYINYELAAPIYRRNFIRKFKALRSQVPELSSKQMRVLELGSATGDFMDVLRDFGVERMLGVEASDYSRQQARERGFEVVDPFTPDYFGQVRAFSPNVICAWDVWEHLEAPGDIFKTLISQNPGVKIVALSTVDSGALVPRIKGKKWRQFHPPTHLNYPTRKSFSLFFEALGYEVVSNRAFGYYRPLADYLSVFLGVKTLNSLPGLFRVPLLLNLFDIQMVIAKPC